MVRLGAAVLLLVFALVWCSQAVRKAERRTGNDLVGYLEASRALYAGGDPYHLPDRFPYIYPLFLAAILRPLAALPVRVASVMWFAIQALCLWCVVRIVAASLARDAPVPEWPTHRGLPVLAAVVIAVFGDVLQNEFLNGQVNVIVLAFALGAIASISRHPHLAALSLGCAIALKLTPALFLLYCAVERRYAVVAESAAWAAVLMLAPWLVVGDRLWPMYAGYVREFILARTTSADSQLHAIFFTPYGFWGWLTGTAPGHTLVVASSTVVVLALVVWHGRIRARVRERTIPAWIYAAVAPLVSPMSEVHHLTTLIPAGMVGALSVWRRHSRAVAAGVAAFVILIWIARFDRQGPWYFLSIVALAGSAAAALGVGHAGGEVPLNSGVSRTK